MGVFVALKGTQFLNFNLLQLHNGFTLPRPKLYTGMIASTFCLTVTEESTT